MKLHEAIENFGWIVAAADAVDLLIAYDAENHVFTTLEGDNSGNYTEKDQYDADHKKGDAEGCEEEANEILDDLLGEGEGDEE